jgi:hypothetical protein
MYGIKVRYCQKAHDPLDVASVMTIRKIGFLADIIWVETAFWS